jgi:outer membrane lipoprotein SlyB
MSPAYTTGAIQAPAGPRSKVRSRERIVGKSRRVIRHTACGAFRTHRIPARSMTKLLAFVGATIGGYLGWWLGGFVGMMTAFMISMVGTGVGMYVGVRIARHYAP